MGVIMDDNEVNKIIAEFMGFVFCEDTLNWNHEFQATLIHEYDAMFTDSLDMLVPVWEKLGCYSELSFFVCQHGFACELLNEESIGDSMEQAAAHATAKAILALKSNK